MVNALALYPGNAGPLGGECAGRVVAIGPGVSGISLGAAVFGMTLGAFATHVTTNALFFAGKPDILSFEAAAALPLLRSRSNRVSGTLLASGRGTRCSSMLPRAASEWLPFNCFCRSGRRSTQRRAGRSGSTVRALGVDDSKIFRFALHRVRRSDSCRHQLTRCGRRPQLSTGEHIAKSLSVLASGGRFLEIGKRDIWTAEKVAALRPDAKYLVYDIGDLAARDPSWVRRTLSGLIERIVDGDLRVPRPTVIAMEHVSAAFRQIWRKESSSGSWSRRFRRWSALKRPRFARIARMSSRVDWEVWDLPSQSGWLTRAAVICS